MAATIATMAMINSKCFTTKMINPTNTKLTASKPTTLFSFQNLPKGLSSAENTSVSTTSMAGTAIAGAIFSSLVSCDAAFAAQQIAEIAEGDNRGLALLLPVIPAIAWVLFNILQPALNQINRMRNSNGVIVGLGLGLGGLAAGSGMLWAPEASAGELGMIADAAAGGSDNRGQLLLFVVAPAIGWVLFNILQPALNQINRMRSE
ncbi:photosystem II core complex proteins psbY, chloroplastic-like [Lotus japonicus]|uniref:photosystem II core complex proteins psbY, chloroplastic-like n=1 Tax=Lotus japonicus TaxID=34305 RepID=UPI00258A65FD|nr:photosystem II core complex proteins psbY, chloroplastic-like [Lotus japonicus]